MNNPAYLYYPHVTSEQMYRIYKIIAAKLTRAQEIFHCKI